MTSISVCEQRLRRMIVPPSLVRRIVRQSQNVTIASCAISEERAENGRPGVDP